MISDETITATIEQCRLSTNVDHARDIGQRALEPLESMDVADRNLALLLLERFVLEHPNGHRVNVKFGHSDAVNKPDCIVCHRPVTAEDWSVTIISRWEESYLWVTWHSDCIENAELEFEFDILDGRITSAVGFI